MTLTARDGTETGLGTARLTLLNDMAGPDFEASLDQQVAWGIEDVDLRADIYGCTVNDLPVDVAERAAEAIAGRGMSVFSLSSGLLVGDVRRDVAVIRAEADALLERVLAAADVLHPRYVRLLAGQLPGRPAAPGAVAELQRSHPAVVDVYRDVARRVVDAGHTPILENEATDCFLGHPQEVLEFLNAVDVDELRFTWDVQNQWAVGTYPELAHLEMLAPYISYFHLKGARAGEDPRVAAWNASLEDSTYPVVEITEAVVRRGLSEVLCLNPTQHGQDLDGYDYASVPEQDLAYLRRSIGGIA